MARTNVGRPAPGNLQALIRGLIINRANKPVAIIGAGSSTMAGTAATSNANRMFDRTIKQIQTAYPSGLGSETTVASLNTGSGAPYTTAGVHGYNGGIGGATSSTYITSTQTAQINTIGATANVIVLHAIGSNDFRTNIAPATVKTNVQTALAALNGLTNPPKAHIFLHIHEPYDATYTYPWGSYGRVFEDLASTTPSTLLSLDMSRDFYPLGIAPNNGLTDTLGFMNADSIHLNDVGHSYLASLVTRALGIPHTATNPVTVADSTAPTVPGTPVATGNAGNISLTWTASTDNTAVTGYHVYRSDNPTTSIGTTATNSYTDGTAAAGTSYTYTVDAYDAVPNTSAKSASSNSATATAGGADVTAPTVPGKPTVEPITNGVKLTWTGSTDNVAVAGYKVYRGGTLLTTLGNVLTYSDTTTTNGTVYAYTISAYDTAATPNESAQSTAGYGMSGTRFDTFNRADSTSAGTADSGQAYNTRLSTALPVAIASNKAVQTQPYTQDTGVTKRQMSSIDVGTGTAAMSFGFHVGATAAAADASGGFAFNIASTGATFTYMSFRQSSSALGLSIVKITSAGGTPTVVQAGTTTVAAGDFVYVTFSGTTASAFINGSSTAAVTSTAVSTKTTSEVGPYFSGAFNGSIDDWVAV